MKDTLLTDRQKEVIRYRKKGMTQQQIADRLGTSKANICTIEKSANENIRREDTFYTQMSLTEKLVFLCKNGKREMLEAYLRNQTILHGREVKDAMKRRGTCERKHTHLKKNRQI